MSITCPEKRQRGFAIVAGIFILVVLAGLAAFVVSVTSTQHLTYAQDVQGARAYQAARAGVEWGLNRWFTTYRCPPSTGTTLTFTDSDLSAFSTTVAGTASTVSGGLTTGGFTTATGTSGSSQIIVADATDMVTGMRVSGAGIAADATITVISGTTLTLSFANTSAVTGNITFGTVFCTIQATAISTGSSEGSLVFVERVVRVVTEN
jgi:MSHA biogenesis protein MshP